MMLHPIYVIEIGSKIYPLKIAIQTKAKIKVHNNIEFFFPDRKLRIGNLANGIELIISIHKMDTIINAILGSP